jgi:hypothetical protein
MTDHLIHTQVMEVGRKVILRSLQGASGTGNSGFDPPSTSEKTTNRQLDSNNRSAG